MDATHTFDPSFSALALDQLDTVSGGFDVNQMVDAGDRWGTAGVLLGSGAGAVAGGVIGAGAGGVGAIPGAAIGAGVGGAAVGALGWIGGAATNAWQQVRG